MKNILDKKKIMFIGGGNMAQALINGLLGRGVKPKNIIVSDPHIQKNDLVTSRGIIGIDPKSPKVKIYLQDADVVLLAVKPQVMKAAVEDFADVLDTQLVVSVAAGLSMQTLSNMLGGYQKIVRTMPNTPSTIQKGASGLYATDSIKQEDKKLAEAVMAASGLVSWVDDEVLLHAVTAVSGSAPAYFFYMIESIINAGIELGLTEKQAGALAMQTALGSAQMAIASDETPAQLRHKVTSPNGTTQAAIESLQDSHFSQIMQKAMQACYDRSEEISEELRN